MRLNRWYWVKAGLFTPEFCDRVVQIGEHQPLQEGRVRHDPKGDQRDSRVSWLTKNAETDWLFRGIGDVVQQTNTAHWGFELSGVESAQYTIYEPGQHYDWHTDQKPDPYPEGRRWAGLIRKLSVVVSLSDGEAYEGGTFQLEEPKRPPTQVEERIKVVEELKTQGSIVIFPAFLFHKVAPVIRGTRRSLVTWYLGKPFR